MYSHFRLAGTYRVLAPMLYDIVDRDVDFHHPKDSVNRVDTPFERGS